MEQAMIQIKDAITALLKGMDPEVDVFYEELKATDAEHGLSAPETYYHVDLIPSGQETVDEIYTDVGILVDIAYHEKKESNIAYLRKGARLDEVIRPVLSFGDRHITIHEANMKIVDHVLHYSFSMHFRYARELAADTQAMEEVIIAIKKGV